MAENSETQLRSEIQRLNSIIDIILNENQQLKQLLCNKGREADEVNHLFYSYAQEEDMPNENIYAIPSETNEAKQTFYSHVSKEYIPKQSFCLIDEKSIGVNNVFCAGASNGDTTKQVFCHTPSQT